ncbi:MAG: hypothetical protein CMA64_05285 [Euryarchaeota archaeon]|nr:hypothetical protein [Euryarchaeota archaeon]
MKNLDSVANELFNKIRGRYPSITVGDGDATITNAPKDARFFEFDFAKGKKVSINLDERDLTIMYSQKLFDEQDVSSKRNWFDFLKELRQFAKKRMLNFDTRDITKSNLDKRDYEYLSTEKQMSESKLYGTSRTSFQDIGSAKMVIKHTGQINQEQPAGRTRDIAGIYIESDAGERFKYPIRHMNGARAMARHVSEGGNPYDDFGKHIVGLSEELAKLRKFKTYMNRSSVMAEGLAKYIDVVNERIESVKKTAHALQSKSHYAEAIKNFENTVLEEVPEDVSNSWIDELTIRQFNEELKDVFPYIYRLVSEANKPKELGPEELMSEDKYGDDPCEYCDGKGYHADEEKKRECEMCDGTGKEEDMDGSDGQPSSYDEYQDLPWGGDDWDHGQFDMESQIEDTFNKIVNGAKWNENPVSEKDKAFDEYKVESALATVLELDEFEFGGKMHKPTLERNVAEQVLSENWLKFLGTGFSKIAPKITGGGKSALSDIATKVAPKVGIGTAKVIAKNPGKVAAAGGGAWLYNKIPSVDELKNLLPNLPDIDLKALAGMAKQYALPLVAIGAALYGGKKMIDWAFSGGDEKEADDKPTTIDVSPKGAHDEMKQKNEIPLDEFVKSMYDYTQNAFPKGETAVLTQVQKQYGDDSVKEAQAMIQELLSGQNREMARIQHLAGVR